LAGLFLLIGSKLAQIVALQVGVTILISLVLLVILGMGSALSAAWGGSIGFVTSGMAAWRSSVTRGDTSRHWLQAQYAAERLKFVGSILCFGATFALYRSVRIPELFLTYIATLLVYWAALLMD
jgi:ATP synthase protein I